MRPRSRLARAAEAIQPLRQGQLDALCGLYSIINGLQLVLHSSQPLRPSQRRRLYRHGLKWLANNEELLSAVSVGMEELTWRRLAGELLREVERVTGHAVTRSYPLRGKAPLTSDAIAAELKSSLRKGRPVLLGLLVTYDHYTVAYGFDAKRLLLFDSIGRRWIKFASLSQHRSEVGGGHQVNPMGVMALSLDHVPP